VGPGPTLLRLDATHTDSSNLERASRATGAPFEVLNIEDEPARDNYGDNLLLERPDLHVAWRGNRASEDAGAIAAVATGRARRETPTGPDFSDSRVASELKMTSDELCTDAWLKNCMRRESDVCYRSAGTSKMHVADTYAHMRERGLRP
jgi:hypothetical protein